MEDSQLVGVLGLAGTLLATAGIWAMFGWAVALFALGAGLMMMAFALA